MSFCTSHTKKSQPSREPHLNELRLSRLSLSGLPLSGLRLFAFCAACVCVWSLFAYGARYANTYVCFDGVFFDRSVDLLWQASLGRYLEYAYRFFTGTTIVPLTSGMLSLIYISVSTFCIASLLNFRQRITIIILSGIMATTLPLTVLNMVFTAQLDTFMLSEALACISVLLWKKRAFGTIPSFALSAFLFWFSLGLYQAFISVYIGLVIIVIAADALKGNSATQLLKSAGRAIGIACAAALLYLLGLFIATHICGVVLAQNGNSISHLGDFTQNNIFVLIARAYKDILAFFFKPSGYNTALIVCAHIVIVAISIVCMIKIARKNRLGAGTITCLCIACILLPLGLNIVYILCAGDTYEVMESSFVLMYVCALYVINASISKSAQAALHNQVAQAAQTNQAVPPNQVAQSALSKQPAQAKQAKLPGQPKRLSSQPKFLTHYVISIALMALVSINSVIYAQGVYTLKTYDYQGTVSFLTRMLDRIEQTPNYEPGTTPVLIVGRISRSLYQSNEAPAFSRYEDTSNRSWIINATLDYQQQYGPFIKYCMDTPINLHCSAYEAAAYETILQSEEYTTMQAFPAQSSCKVIDGVVVVKLSDND